MPRFQIQTWPLYFNGSDSLSSSVNKTLIVS